MQQELKNDLIATYNEAEELATSLNNLTDEEIIQCKNSLIKRTEYIKNWIGKYVSDEDIIELINK